jgi:hypothetical protein
VPTLGGLKAPGPCYLALNYALQRTEESDAERKVACRCPLKQRNLQTRQSLNEAVKTGIPGFIPKGERI